MTPEQRVRRHKLRQLGALVVLPGVVLGTASLSAAVGGGLFTKAPPPPPCPPTVVTAPARGSFDLKVLNATGEGGRATMVGKELGKRRFHVVEMSNAPENLYVRTAGVIHHGPAALDQALLVQKQFPDARLFDDGRKGTGVTLVIGSGFTALAPRPPVEQPRPSQVKVNVYNATWRPGLAKEVQEDLGSRGFKPGEMGNDPDKAFLPDDTAWIRYGKEHFLEAKLLAQHVPGAVLKPITREGAVLDLVIGNKYDSLTPFADVPPLPPLPKKVAETVARPGVCTTTTS
jgi:hypothetical protein